MAITVKHFKKPADNYLFALTERMGMWDCCFVFELLRITLTSQPHRNNQTKIDLLGKSVKVWPS